MTPHPSSHVPIVPVLPESAPFTPEQRAYLNGFLAGLFSFSPIPAAGTIAAPPPVPLRPLSILFGSQTGTAEKLAKRVAKEAAKHGFAPTTHDLARLQPSDLAAADTALLLTSTYGDGEPPDNARSFWTWLKSDSAPRLDRLRFSVCALGDQNYPRFCQFGRDVDARFEALGAQRAHPRQDCDVDLERPFQSWLAGVLQSLGTATSLPSAADTSPASVASPETDDESPRYSRSRPYSARLKTNRRLSDARSAKDVRHFEILLQDPAMTYEVGDALGVWPANHPELANAVLAALGCDGEEAVPGRDEQPVPFRLALFDHYELGRIPPSLLQHFAEASGDAELARLASPTANGDLQRFLYGRDVLDLLEAYPAARPTPERLISLLRKLQPRLYSISSSPKTHPGEVHLTVSAVRYDARGRPRRGVASCFLADRCDADTTVPVFIHSNPAFRPPADDVPLIMIGPGTGIAPFRAFLEERIARGARGRNWLFFGDQHQELDYLYREEMESFRQQGHLTRLDLAWSRDQAGKIYVQHRILENAAELWRWLEEGAAFAVCGDASRMAKDVDIALHQVIEQAGQRSPDAAREYVANLQANKRYMRDVY